ncbi:class I SAM-dependent methyltransferase [Photobacterium galatheae]|uniref:class I SAM-dependent methyltransferase n=1 Tax=Photobacterium galatheae TaxID=1654360 RepID=UPI00202D067B|nr:class I SAM-dependent methyltransferase [Photobacterium galatheae]MCM0148639.1 class I SAM-dependent methyltransferase [Photobacterium galatheae]
MATIDWQTYLSPSALQPPRTHLIEAHQLLGDQLRGKVAVDCGCGRGRDTFFLLENQYRVYAFDNHLESLRQLSTHPLAASNPLLDLQHCSFSEYRFPKAHLVNASASLFFCPRQDFYAVWQKIVQCLYPGGLFCGHFLGMNGDETDYSEQVMTLSRQELERLFSQFYVVSWQQRHEVSSRLTGTKHQWHIHTFIAMKK